MAQLTYREHIAQTPTQHCSIWNAKLPRPLCGTASAFCGCSRRNCYFSGGFPELNPAERFFEQLRKELSNQAFETITAVEDKLYQVLKKDYQNSKAIISLTNYP